jgi:hypothetical protein
VRASLAATLLTLSASMPLAEQPITFHGIGPVRVGLSLADASRAAGEELVEAGDKPSGTEGCYHARLKSSPSLLFMVEEGRVTRVETADPRFRTHSGARVGDSEARVRRVYGRRLEVTEHKYDETGHYLIVRSADKRYALVMETDGKEVVYIRAGMEPAAEYVEGCL